MDRAAGTLLGAAVAVCLVGAPPAMAGELAHPDGDSVGPSQLAWLVTTALGHLDDPAGLAGVIGTAPERAWAVALRGTVADGRVPPADLALPHGPALVGWRSALETPVPRLDPVRRVFPCSQLVGAIWSAHARGGDEAAMYAGALAGARWGASGIALDSQRRLADILPPRLLVTIALGALPGADPGDWPHCRSLARSEAERLREPAFQVPHPHDPGVVLCDMEYVRTSRDAEAVVSLCRMGTDDHPAHLPARDTVQVWLYDTPGANPNLHFVLDDAARAVAALRAEGKRVLLHCWACQSRTPAVAAHYAALTRGADVREGLRAVIRAVGGHLRNPELARAAAALNGVRLEDPARALFPDGEPEVTRMPPG
ncbi:hypothetical protein DEF23_12915 [Marinitenerispora sediminis]|uniref:Tyrosine specific protein phosphatases domain-containing protein n=1 Tax=Marinitenerispora sediminis TaxID=1931232 RepID=A0A368T237_9ACTN|nr:hypothetical protein DEF24_18705 [Marinitenerispora sediminis]RCV55079.1 hypothetical protein DEF28_06800 [Marinitenerispora sediminis]RCV56251.1 hypothetical protein DEF23_12915 [Marinitenerispora sediminis]